MAFVAGLGGCWAYARIGAEPVDLVRDLSVGWAFAASGLVAWARRPANRTGPLLLAEGLAWFLGNLQGLPVPLLFAISAWGEALNMAVLAHLLLVFPDGRASTARERRVIAAGYLLVAVGGLIRVLLYDPTADSSTSYLSCPECGPNAFLVLHDTDLFDAVDLVYRWAGVVLTVLVAMTMVRRWRTASRARRRVLLPSWVAVGLTLTFVGWEVLYLLMPEALSSADAVLTVPSDISEVAVPVVFLVSLLRMRLRRASVGDLLVTAGRAPTARDLQEVLRQTLGDSSLVLGLRTGDGGYADPDGRPLTAPPARAGSSVTHVDTGQGADAVLEHDSALGEDPALLAAAGAVVRMWLRDARLRAQADERADKALMVPRRLLQAAYEERRQLERDLHDGAQTRLLYTLMTLRRLGPRLPSGADPALRRTVAEAEESLRQALEELRDLARGIHPAVLGQSGLGPALTALAEQCPVPVTVEAEPGRYQPLVETTAYFVVCEAMANAVKHAAARCIEVRSRRIGTRLVVEVADDGVGGVDDLSSATSSSSSSFSSSSSSGSGLRGLADRVSAVGGTLEVESPRGKGTWIRAELPCE
ncbi:ATP-binding protein [Streptomyces griseocarneus]|uniref:ATP-binding protein n=1 Tax=Streptomyces griseocarneus TaxID=51201 RepID=UPI001CCBBB5A|nr:ATP-binding protein [Streptomyces griseocarneus]MBZ6475108.1 histidine kinase [Streptomyces griseocarneus]